MKSLSESELICIIHLASTALSDADIFVDTLEHMDLSVESLKELQEKLYIILNNHNKMMISG